MFDKDHDDRQDGPATAAPTVPPLRKFIVRRLNCDGDYIMADETIMAHEVETNAAGMGNVVRFRELMIHPTEGPCNRVVRSIMKPADAWLEYEEIVLDAVAAPSILH